MNAAGLKAFEVSVIGTDWSRIVHALSAGKAKSKYWHEVREPWPDVPFTAIRCRCVGTPQTGADFGKTAAYRGVPLAKIGMRVVCDGMEGVIVGKNSSANFNVLFISGRFSGQELNCHPNYHMTYYAEDGSVIYEFKG